MKDMNSRLSPAETPDVPSTCDHSARTDVYRSRRRCIDASVQDIGHCNIAHAGPIDRDVTKPTIGTILDSFITDAAELASIGQRSPKTVKSYRSLRRLFSQVEHLDAETTTPLDLRGWVRDVAATAADRPRSKGGAATASAALRLLKAAYREAEGLGVLPRGCSPASYVRELRVPPRRRYLSAAELRRVWAAIDAEETRRRRLGRSLAAVEAVRLLVLTGQRHREILGLRWDDLDDECAVLRLERTKTGYREVPLSAAASAAVRRQRVRVGDGCQWVFPSPMKDDAPLESVDYLWRKIRHEAELDDGKVVMHTLRHTLGTLSQLDGAAIERISEALGHSSTAITRRVYCRPLATPGARELMERHAERLSA